MEMNSVGNHFVNKNTPMRAVIIVSVQNVYYDVKKLIREEVSENWFDDEEVDELIIRIFGFLISSILNNIITKHSKLYETCLQGNIDYLEYRGLSPDTAFRISHLSESGILKAIIDVYPFIDDEHLLSVVDFRIINITDIFINVEFKENKPNEPKYNYCANGQYSAIV